MFGLWANCLDYSMPHPCIEEVLKRSKDKRLDIVLPSLISEILRYHDEDSSPYPQSNESGELLIDLLTQEQEFLHWRAVLPKDTTVFRRCRNLVLALSGNDWEAFSPHLTSNLSRFDSLSLACDRMGVTPLGPPNLFEDSNPWKLKSLNLRRCIMPLKAPPLGLLEELTVYCLSSQAAWTPDGWLNLLQDLPLLRRLDLQFSQVDPKDLDVEDRRLHVRSVSLPVRLPHLERLVLRDCCVAGSDLVTSLIFPLECVVMVELCCVWNLDEKFDNFCSWLSKRYNKNGALGPSMVVKLDEKECVISSGIYCQEYSNVDEVNLELTLDFERRFSLPGRYRCEANFHPCELLIKVMAAIREPCASMTTIDLGFCFDIPFPHEQIFPAFVAVDTMVLFYSSGRTFYSLIPFFEGRGALSPEADANSNKPQEPDQGAKLLPSLHLVSIKETEDTEDVKDYISAHIQPSEIIFDVETYSR
ncbi:hypothetical protein BDZ97DRAFT_2076311 [Flammula alnicola]|nr:hypothetical protein BDZ97DRAFT_2076311 [Flammula alnicola]